MCVCFCLKSIVSLAQEKQSTDGTIKKCVLFNGANFVKAVKFHRNNIFKRKKDKIYPDLTKVFVNLIVCTAVEKKGGGETSFFSDELISGKTQNKGKFCFFLTSMLVS